MSRQSQVSFDGKVRGLRALTAVWLTDKMYLGNVFSNISGHYYFRSRIYDKINSFVVITTQFGQPVFDTEETLAFEKSLDLLESRSIQLKSDYYKNYEHTNYMHRVGDTTFWKKIESTGAGKRDRPPVWPVRVSQNQNV